MSTSLLAISSAGSDHFLADTAQFPLIVPFLQRLAKYLGTEGKTSPFAEYQGVVFWATRRLEYSFAIREVNSYSAGRRGPLKILDVGCGVVPLNNYYSSCGHEVTACDQWSRCISFLTSEIRANELHCSQVRYECQDASFLPYPDEAFDIVHCISVLEHLVPGRDWLALDEMVRVLKIGGQLVLTFDCRPDTDDLGPDEAVIRTGIPEGVRIYELPFKRQEAQALLSRWNSVMDFSPDACTPFDRLTRESLETFWRSHRQEDDREEAVRNYIALGLSARKTVSSVGVAPEGESDTRKILLLGQEVLDRRLAYYRKHCWERLRIIESMSRRPSGAVRGVDTGTGLASKSS